TNKKAVKFLTKSEKKRFNEAKIIRQEEQRVKDQEELNRIEDSFTTKQFDDE
ncbi:DNA polymerase III subunit epsilon, partial [Vibrio sp. 10N.261.48.A2]